MKVRNSFPLLILFSTLFTLDGWSQEFSFSNQNNCGCPVGTTCQKGVEADRESLEKDFDLSAGGHSLGGDRVVFCLARKQAPAQEKKVEQATTDNCGCNAGVECIKARYSDLDSLSQKYSPKYMAGFSDSDGNQKYLVCLDPLEKSSASDSGCYTDFQNAKSQCLSEATKASTDCDQENASIQDAMNATKAIGAGSAVSMQLACSKLGQISKIANTALTGWQSYCAYSQGSCESSCTRTKALYEMAGCIPESEKPSLVPEMTKVRGHITTCLSYKQRINEASQHAMAALVQLQAAKKCEDDTAIATNNLDKCKDDPTNPLCADSQKCSNADFAAKNPVCKCFNNPGSAECLAKNQGTATRSLAGSGLTSPGSGNGANSDGSFSSLGAGGSAPGADPFATSLRDNAFKGDNTNLSGQKGNAGLGGGSGSGGGGHGGGAGGSGGGGSGSHDPNDRTKVNSGFYGANPAAGGSGYFGKNSGYGGAGGAGRPTTVGGINYNKLKGSQFDPRRYIAGLNGKGGEYINGPGLDIFKIVKNRIEIKKPTLLDPDFRK